MNIYLINEHSYIIIGEEDLSGRWQKWWDIGFAYRYLCASTSAYGVTQVKVLVSKLRSAIFLNGNYAGAPADQFSIVLFP